MIERDEIYDTVIAECGEYDPTRWQRGSVEIKFAFDNNLFDSAEKVQFAISQMLFDRFEGVCAEVVIK